MKTDEGGSLGSLFRPTANSPPMQTLPVPPLMLAPTGRAQRQKPGELGEGVTGKIVPESLRPAEGDVPRVYPQPAPCQPGA